MSDIALDNKQNRKVIFNNHQGGFIVKLALFLPQIGAYSETFIQNHILFLAPENTVVITSKIGDRWHLPDTPVLEIKQTGLWAKYSQEDEERLCGFLHKHGVTHLLIEFPNTFTAIAELNLRRLKLPLTLHFHGYDASQMLNNENVVGFYNWTASVCGGFIAVSEVMKNRLAAHGIQEDKIYVNYYGVNKEKLKPLAPRNDGRCRFLFIGRFVSKKAPLILLEAFRIAYQQEKNIELVMIGDTTEYHAKDNLLERSKAFVKENGLDGVVRFTGSIPHEEVMDELSMADVYIQHSIKCPETGDSEGLPNSILEASLSGLPVIATIHEGIPEAVIHGENGFLVQEGDAQGMAEHIISLARSPETRTKMGLRSLELNSIKFDIRTSIAKLRNILLSAEMNITDEAAARALAEHEKRNPEYSNSARIKKIIDENKDSIFVLLGAGYGLTLHWDFIVRSGLKDRISFIVDDNVKTFMGQDTIPFGKLISDNKGKKIVFLLTVASKENFELLRKKVDNEVSITSKVFALSPYLI